MPATLPWPKMPNTPAKNGCSLAVAAGVLLRQKPTIACAIVRRQVVGMIRPPSPPPSPLSPPPPPPPPFVDGFDAPARLSA